MFKFIQRLSNTQKTVYGCIAAACVAIFAVNFKSCVQGFSEGSSDYFYRQYQAENDWYSQCRSEGRTTTECDLLYQELQTRKAEEEALKAQSFRDYSSVD